MPKQLTNEEFLIKFKENNHHDITLLGKYVNSKTKIPAICNICGYKWDARPRNLLTGSGCTKCANKYKEKVKPWTQEKFLEELKKRNHHNLIIIGEYKGNSMPIKVRCDDCGCEYTTKPVNLLQDCDCPKCASKKQVENNSSTQEYFQKRVTENCPDIIVTGTYINGSSPVEAYCKKCESTFTVNRAEYLIYNKFPCPICRKENKRKISQKEFERRVHIHNPEYEILSKYESNDSLITVKCHKCDKTFVSRAELLMNGKKCPGCSLDRKRKEEHNFICELQKEKPNIVLIGPYISKTSITLFKCTHCGYEWKSTPSKILSKGRCNCCFKRVVPIEPRKAKFLNKLSEINPNIELIGEYKGQIELTQFRYKTCGHIIETKPYLLLSGDNKYCKICDIEHSHPKLVLQKNKKEFEENFDIRNPDYELLSEYKGVLVPVEVKCKKCGEIFSVAPKNLNKKCECKSCKRHDAFIKKFKNKYKDKYSVLGRYAGLDEPLLVRCNKCGCEFNYKASYYLEKEFDCTICYDRPKRPITTQKEFEMRINKRLPNVTVLDSFEGKTCKDKVQLKCNDCGYEWSPILNDIFHTLKGCKRCDQKKLRKDPDEFEQEIKEILPNVKLLEKYEKRATKIKTLCLDCGHIWDAVPRYLSAGCGCPECNNIGTSVGERTILYAFRKRLGEENVKLHDNNAIGKELDIYLPSFNFAIEYGGWYWHKERVISDYEKMIECQNKGIKLITVYDGFPDDEVKPYQENYLYFKRNLSKLVGEKDLIELINYLFDEVKIERLTNEEMEEVIQKALINHYSGKAKISFAKAVKKGNPSLELKGEYLGNERKTTFYCNECNSTFDRTPAYLKRTKYECPICKKVAKN